MKKIYLILTIILSLGFVACTSVKNTDLNNIKIDNILLRENIDSVDLSKYESIDRYDDEYNYQFKELQIKTNSNNGIDKIWLNILEFKYLSINENDKFETIDEITAILGSNYKECWYDKEQGLKSHEYIDRAIKTKANFIYNGLSNQKKELVWIILENI